MKLYFYEMFIQSDAYGDITHTGYLEETNFGLVEWKESGHTGGYKSLEEYINYYNSNPVKRLTIVELE